MSCGIDITHSSASRVAFEDFHVQDNEAVRDRPTGRHSAVRLSYFSEDFTPPCLKIAKSSLTVCSPLPGRKPILHLHLPPWGR